MLKKFINLIVVLVFIVVFTTSVFAATVPVIGTIYSPLSGSYLLENTSILCSANISNSPTSVTVTYKVPYLHATPALQYGTLYSGNWNLTNKTSYKPGYYSGGSWYMNSVVFTAKNTAGTATKTISAYPTVGALTDYRSIDSSFTYYSATSSSFYGVATGTAPASYNGQTGTYNCLAYSVNVNSSWQWPWLANATYDEAKAYMTKGKYNNVDYSARPGTTYSTASSNVISYAKVIAYGDSTGIKHFAKVISWDASGNPLKIRSKWGYWELINSATANPFTSVYGTPKAYYK